MVAVLLLIVSSPVNGCIWINRTTIHGENVRVLDLSPASYITRLNIHQSRQEWEKQLEESTARLKDSTDYHDRSDHGAILVHLGRTKEALEIFQSIEKEHPGDYVTAANMGTTYELLGDDQQALTWIQEAIRRNPDSHEGTEWLHVKILEAKLALAKDSHWLATHTVSGISFGNGRSPSPQPTNELARFQKAFEYQLGERLEFVKPPDPIVADLLFDLGNTLALTKGVENAEALYEFSLEYGPLRSATIHLRQKHYHRLIWWGNFKFQLKWALAIGGLIAVLLYAIWRRCRSRKKLQATVT